MSSTPKSSNSELKPTFNSKECVDYLQKGIPPSSFDFKLKITYQHVNNSLTQGGKTPSHNFKILKSLQEVNQNQLSIAIEV
jgi:hypothetical protein